MAGIAGDCAKQMKKHFALILLGLGVTLLLPFAAQPQERWDKVVAEAKKDGKVVVSQVGRVPGNAARARAIDLLGDDVQFVRGTTAGNAPGVRGGDAEARAIHFLGPNASGARQVSTHFACGYCASRQGAAGVINLTGTAAVEGTGEIGRPLTYEQLPPR